MNPAIKHAQLAGADNVRAEAYAPRTKDAAFGVKDDMRTDGKVFDTDQFLIYEAGVSGPVSQCVILQRALPPLVTNRAVKGMIQQKKFQNRLPGFDHCRSAGPDFHALPHHRGTSGLELGHFIDFYMAHSAGRHHPQLWMETIPRNFDAGMLRCLDDVNPVRNRDLLAINGQLGHSLLLHRKSPAFLPSLAKRGRGGLGSALKTQNW